MSVLSGKRALICLGLPFILCSCTQAFRCNNSKPFQALSPGTATVTNASIVSTMEPVELKKALAFIEYRPVGGGSAQSAFPAEAARLCFLVGQLGEAEASERYFEKGRFFAEMLCKSEPSGVAGHYWLAMNLCGLAEVGGAGRALRLIPRIVEELETAASIDGSYDQGGPHRALGRIYCEAPCWPLSEGNMGESIQHLLAAVEIAPDNITNHLYLAQTLIKLGRFEEAQIELDGALRCKSHSLSPLSLEEDRRQVLHLMGCSARVGGGP